jgi:tRNA-specific 2-thiouridylase
VIGLTITPFKIDPSCRTSNNPKNCCTLNGYTDAMSVAEKLGITHKFLDLTSAFKEKVVDYFIDEYLHGRTPNPCSQCNPSIKWGGLLEKANEMNAFYIATGHYARTRFDKGSGRYILSKGKDPAKDQSYFLWGLTQEQLSRTLFPLGEYTKDVTRQLSQQFDLSVTKKPDSQEICFIMDNDYHNFLRKNVPNLEEKAPGGDIVMNGERVGTHKGIPFYTIGQRKGLGITNESPLFVTKIDHNSNTIQVGNQEELLSTSLLARNVNLIKYAHLDESRLFTVKIRYKDEGSPAWCRMNSEGQLEVSFLTPRRAITPGQSVVMFEGDDIVGGGIIL